MIIKSDGKKSLSGLAMRGQDEEDVFNFDRTVNGGLDYFMDSYDSPEGLYMGLELKHALCELTGEDLDAEMWLDDAFLEVVKYFQKLNPKLTDEDVLKYHLFALRSKEESFEDVEPSLPYDPVDIGYYIIHDPYIVLFNSEDPDFKLIVAPKSREEYSLASFSGYEELTKKCYQMNDKNSNSTDKSDEEGK